MPVYISYNHYLQYRTYRHEFISFFDGICNTLLYIIKYRVWKFFYHDRSFLYNVLKLHHMMTCRFIFCVLTHNRECSKPRRPSLFIESPTTRKNFLIITRFGVLQTVWINLMYGQYLEMKKMFYSDSFFLAYFSLFFIDNPTNIFYVRHVELLIMNRFTWRSWMIILDRHDGIEGLIYSAVI